MKTFTILEFAGCNWGVDISHLREVIEQLPSTPVPLAPETVRGVINLRGDLVPVLALDFWLNLATPGANLLRRPWMAVIDFDHYYFGVLAERVNTATFEGELAPPPQGMVAVVEGVAETSIGPVNILRLPSLVRHLEQGLKSDRFLSTTPIAA